MDDRSRHLLHHPARRWPLPGQIDDPCDAAHSATIAEDGFEKSREMRAPSMIGPAAARAQEIGKERVWQVADEKMCTLVNGPPSVNVTFSPGDG